MSNPKKRRSPYQPYTIKYRSNELREIVVYYCNASGRKQWEVAEAALFQYLTPLVAKIEEDEDAAR